MPGETGDGGNGKASRKADPLIIAHRGARSAEARENTLAAFQRAVELGVPWIELDVQLHRGHLWVFHDRRLERCTNGQGWLADHGVRELRQLEVGKGQRIPWLPEVLECVDRRARINVEIKTAEGTAEAVARTLRQAFKSGWQPDDFLVSSFHHPELREFRRILPEVPAGVVEAGVPLELAAVATTLGAQALSMALAFPEPGLIADAHRRGLKVFMYTVNEPDDVRRARDMGVDGVFTDYPDQAREALNA